MSKSRIHVLIVEDDLTQGKALLEAYTRDGYSAVLCQTSVQALTTAQRTEFHCLIVDCMLPKMNGVDLVEEILQFLPNKPKVFLVSGIFKDRNFIKEAMERTNADSFFIKPLRLAEILNHTEELFSQQMGPENPPVLCLYSSRQLEDAELIALVEKESTLHAFHLPKLYQRMQESTLTGELTLISAVGDISTVCFYHGQVFSVKTGDKDSYFGGLAVSYGFVSPEDVMTALKDQSKKVLGQKLVESMSLSPHAVQVILEEQLALRLSQTIQDDVVGLQWVNKKFATPQFSLVENRFEQLLEDWLESKITPDWAKSILMLWGSFLLEGEYHPRIRGSMTIEQVYSEEKFNDQTDPLPLFRALIKGRAFIGLRGESVQDFSFLESRLDKMATDFKHQNYFQFLGVGEKAHQREISRSYQGLRDSFDPQNLPVGCPPALAAKCAKVFKLIQMAHDTVADDVERLRYLQSLQNKRSQELLEAEPIFRAAILELHSGQYAQAAKKFQDLQERKLEFKDLRAYRVWAGLKKDRNYSQVRLDQVPPEERHSAAFMMARGVYHRSRGQYKKALDAFRAAHLLDSRLTVAHHELKQLIQELERNKTQNRAVIRDVTSVVENMFTKKPRRGA